MYVVTTMFTDLQDNGHRYEVGDAYPRAGLEVSAARIKELASADNKRGVALIEEVAEELPEEKPVVKKQKRGAKASKK